MFEKEIKFITDFNLNKIKKSGSFFTITHLAAANVHPAIIQYISAELDYLILIDRQRLLQKSVFDYSGEEVVQYLELISTEIKKEKLIPYEDIKRLISQAVEFNVYFLIRPRWCLKKFIFGDEEVRSHNEIKTYLNYTYFFDYYKNILQAILEKKKIVSISVYEFEDLIVNLEKQLIQKQQQTFIENALQSLAEFFNLGEIQKSKIALGIVEKFLYEKGLLNEIFKVRKLLSVDPKSKFEIEEIKQAILSNISVDSSNIEISEKIFEIPKTPIELPQIVESQVEVFVPEEELISPENLSDTNSDFLQSEVDFFEQENLNEVKSETDENISDSSNEAEEIIDQESVPIEIEDEIDTQMSESEEVLSYEIEDEIDLSSEFDGTNEPSDEKISTDKATVEEEAEELKQSEEIEEISETVLTDEVNVDQEVIPDEVEELSVEVEVSKDEAAALYEDFLNSDEIPKNDSIENNDIITSDESAIQNDELVDSNDTDEAVINVEEELTTPESIFDTPEETKTLYSENSQMESESTNDEFDLLKTIEQEIENLQNIETTNVESEVNEFLQTENFIAPDDTVLSDENSLMEDIFIDVEIPNTPDYEVVEDVFENIIVDDSSSISETTNDVEETSHVEVIEESIENKSVDEWDTQSEITNEIEEVLVKEETEIKEETVSIKHTVTASADEIFNLFTQKETTKIISSIFQKDELDFVHTVEQISECRSFKQVEGILNLVFHSYRINSLTQKEAIIFKEKIAIYFKEKEK
jgi:hypothetical protein